MFAQQFVETLLLRLECLQLNNLLRRCASELLAPLEVSLKMLGMLSAANLVRSNLKLAMEFFEH